MESGFNIGEKLNFQGSSAEETYSSFGELISNVLPNVYIGAGLVLLIMLIVGGFMLIASAGNPDKQQEAKKVITGSIVGFVIVFTSYWIIQIIQIVTGIPILNSGL